jgi:tetraacyldisaccharide 4'-kinase
MVLMQPGEDRGAWRVPDAAADFAEPRLMAWIETIRPATLDGNRVLAFAGIARPEKFFAGLARIGLTVAGTRAFTDHHPFTPRDWARLIDEARRLGAALVTTAKDAARLTPEQRKSVHVATARVRFDDETILETLLDAVLARAKP